MARNVFYRRALVTSVGLSLLFLLVYGGCLWITARRHDVGVFYFAWERALPFVPFMIAPYLSIDLFFVAAPFFLSTERSLQLFVRRVVSAILFAGICFLLFPLRFAFARPVASGSLGAVFDFFRTLDAPYNLCPSLHAALVVILAAVYFRALLGAARLAVLSWFSLIAVSPMLTRQHHVLDIVCGFALGAACCFFFREKNSLASSRALASS